MRMSILVAIATLLLGLGVMYTTAKASSYSVFDQPISLYVTPIPPPVDLAAYTKIDFVPPPTLQVQDQFNDVVQKHAEAIRQREVSCLAKNIYFEARGESMKGKITVGEVTINRVKAGTFEDSICGVVHQHAREYHHRPAGCQFAWVCNGDKHKIVSPIVYAQILSIAEDLYDHYYIDDTMTSLVKGALYFHTRAVDVGPRKWKRVVARIDHHVFYNQVAQL